ncbi:hypothetical protein L0222_03755 [bacterium]|nr:hypothetical protein [bacterium]MCI0606486.1 hypothetical protein [bacterium]
MELQTTLQSLSRIHFFVKFPVLASLFAAIEEQGFIAARPCVDGVEFRFLNEIHGLPNRCYLRVYFPTESKCVLFFHKKSSVPFSHDRFSYGGVVMDIRSTERFDTEDVKEWVLFLKNGMPPDLRPKTLKKSIPYTIPED